MNPATKSLLLTVSPNPFEKNIWIRILSSDFEEGSLILFNIYGQAIQRESILLNPRINKFEMELENIPAAGYTICTLQRKSAGYL